MIITIYGVDPFNLNRGVNALAYGSVKVVSKNYPKAQIIILGAGKQDKRDWGFDVQGATNSFDFYSYSRIQYFFAFINGLLKVDLVDYSFGKLRFFKKNELSELLKKSEFFININEGDSFSDIYGKKRFFKHFIASMAALAWKTKIVFLPQTIGPFKSPLIRYFALSLLKRIDNLFVRDTKTSLLLKNSQIPFQLSTDVSFLMTPQKPKLRKEYSNYIAINISGLMYLNSYSSLKNKFSSYPEIIKSLILAFKKKGLDILLIPHTYSCNENMGENDLSAIKQLIHENKDFQLNYIDEELTAPELKYLISKSSFFVGSRMHACFAALSTCVPCIGLGYSFKFQGGFETFGVPNLGMDVSNIESDKIQLLISEIEDIYDRREEIKMILEESCSKMKPLAF